MPAPDAPTGLVATTTDPTEVDLGWAQAQTNSPTSSEVWRDGVLLHTINDGTTVIYDDTSTHAGRSYVYKVRSHNASGYSAFSAEVTVSTHAVAYGYEIALGDKLFRLRGGTHFKSEQPTGAAPQIGTRLDLSPLKKWVQNDWRGGLGQKRLQDMQMFDDGAIDSYTDPHKLGCLPQLSKVTTGTTSVLKDQGNSQRFEVRAYSDSVQAGLYIALKGLNDNNGEVWKYTNTGGTLSRLTQQAKHFSAILSSWRDDPHNLMVGTDQEAGSPHGKLYKFPGGSDTFGATALTVNLSGGGATFDNPRVTALINYNDADYIGIGNYTAGAVLYRIFGTTISKFKDIDCHFVADMAVWNGRLWILAIMRNAWSRLYTTDGNTVAEAYTWRDGFYGKRLHVHGGQLYIVGGKETYDGLYAIGQVHRYNGASMDPIAEFDSSGLATLPTFSSFNASIESVGSFGKLLVVGFRGRTLVDSSSHRGLYFYDPAEDSWHQGPYKDDSDHAHTGNWSAATDRTTDLKEFDGALYIGYEDSAGNIYYLKNDKTAFVKSFYRTSIFDAGLPREDKLFTRVVLEVDMAPKSRVSVSYSKDEGVTWSSATNFDNTAATTRLVQEVALQLGTNSEGVIAKSIQLLVTLYPGTATTGNPGDSSGTSTTYLTATQVEYDIAPVQLYNWTFNVPMASNQITLFNTLDERTGQEILDDLRTLRDARTLVEFEDIDGEIYQVKFLSVDRFVPDITLDDVDGLHGDIPVRLQQMVEA